MATSRPTYTSVVVDRVTRIYGSTRALAGVSVTFTAGEVTVIEGGNGAGKSTLLAILSTLARPTSGSVRWGELGLPGDRDAIRATLGFVAHETLLPGELSPRENLTLMAGLYGLDPENPTETVSLALSRAGLRGLEDRPARTLSRGQLQRLAIARATLHDPTLLLFDEPTTGLDTASVARLEAFITEARQRQKIIVVVTHDTAFASRIADLTVVLERGRLREIHRGENLGTSYRATSGDTQKK